MFVSASNVSPISYKIGQKIENSRLMQGHTQIELASKIGSLIAHKSTIIFTQIKTAYLLHNPW